MIDVNTQQFDTLRTLGSGCYGTVLAVTIEGHPDIEMAVKVNAMKFMVINNLNIHSSFFFSSQRIVLETQEDRQASTYTDLTTIQNVGSQNYPYIISYYGAVIDRVSYRWIVVFTMENILGK